ncbi:MAG: tetratricopeptide repeat protein [Patescibacteria group bacterium]|nr:tetratricopeptide repeat protein [Patescibacteria group bacterium]
MDKISVIIYGPASFGNVVPTVHSIFNGTYRNLEVILLDDGTLTDVDSLLDEYEGKITHLKVFTDSKARHLNQAAACATGEMLAFLDGKDISGKMRFELLVKKMLEIPDVGLAFCGMTYINQDGQFLQGVKLINDFSPEHGLGRLFESNYLGSISTTLLVRDVFEKAGKFDEHLTINEDYDLYLRIARHFTIQYVNLPLLRYRVVPDSARHLKNLLSESERYILKKHDVGIIADSLTKIYSDEESFRLALGQILNRMGKEEDALQNYKRVLILNDKNSEVYFLIGNYFYQRGCLEEAQAWYNKCLNYNPNHAGSRNNLGVILYLLGALEESRLEFDRANHLRENYYDAIFNLRCLQKKVSTGNLRITGVGEDSALLSLFQDVEFANPISRPSLRKTRDR